jgi:hypothetical protein
LKERQPAVDIQSKNLATESPAGFAIAASINNMQYADYYS